MGKLFKTLGFLPYILVLFLNAFVDLGHKITIQNTVFKTYDGQEQIVLTAIVNALILLPFILLFTPAGFLSDKYPKNKVMRITAWGAVILTSLITLFYYLGLFWAAFSMTFVLALQSALYSPAKFGYIKELVGKERLSAANGLVQASTMVAILGSTFVFSILFESKLSQAGYANKSELLKIIAPIGWCLILGSVIELVLAYRLPQKKDTDTNKRFDWSKYKRGKYLKGNLSIVYNHPVIWLSIIGLSIFWALSQVLLASFPAFAKETMGMVSTVVIQGMMACAGIGIMLGSITSGKVSKNHIETGLLPIGAIGIAVTLALMPNLNSAWTHSLNFLVLGFMGGIFVVPLNALIQFHAKEKELGLVLAGNNLIQTTVMLGFLVMTVILAQLGLSSSGLFFLLTIVAVIGAIYTLYHLPQSFSRLLVSRLISSKFRLQVLGFENIPESGGVLMLGNHISFIDWAIIQMACPRQVRFVMERSYYERWYLKWLLDLFGVIPIARGSSKEALVTIRETINNGEVVCLFPEGLVSRTGHLSEFKHGYERAAAGAEGVILPFYLDGLWGSQFSRASEKLKNTPRLSKSTSRRDLVVSFGEPLSMKTVTSDLKRSIFDLSMTSWRYYSQTLRSISTTWLETAKRTAGSTSLIESSAKTGRHISLTGHSILTQSICLSRTIRKHCREEQNIGLILPPTSYGIIANLAVLLEGKTVVNLHEGIIHKNLQEVCAKADIKSVIVSSAYITTAQKEVSGFKQRVSNINLLIIDDLLSESGQLSRLTTQLLATTLPSSLLQSLFNKGRDPDAAAAIFFPAEIDDQHELANAVVLTHRNIMANIKQMAHVLNTEESDVVLASQPLSMAFGMTVTTLMPLVEGIPLICHSQHDNFLASAKAIAQHKVTVLCARPSQLQVCHSNDRINPLMLKTLRIIVSGGEKYNLEMNEQILAHFKHKFNQEIYAGYGTTETSPVISVNVPDKIDLRNMKVQPGGKAGSVGMPLPGTSIRIVDSETMKELAINEVGQILVGGAQVMQGYLDDQQKNNNVIIESEGLRWYKSNESGYLDEDGFLFLTSSE